MQKNHSDATLLLALGSLVVSVQDMATSPDFYRTFKKLFNLSILDFWWTQPRADKSGNFIPAKLQVHIESDTSDSEKIPEMFQYFNQNNSSIDKNFFCTPMSLIPIFKPFLDNDIKDRINMHVRKQESLGKGVKSITISGVEVLNFAGPAKIDTLHHELMSVESIYKKVPKEALTKNASKARFSI